VSKKKTLGIPFFAIGTISIIPDPDVGHHKKAWLNHQ
jgi:hypothetical protein